MRLTCKENEKNKFFDDFNEEDNNLLFVIFAESESANSEDDDADEPSIEDKGCTIHCIMNMFDNDNDENVYFEHGY